MEPDSETFGFFKSLYFNSGRRKIILDKIETRWK